MSSAVPENHVKIDSTMAMTDGHDLVLSQSPEPLLCQHIRIERHHLEIGKSKLGEGGSGVMRLGKLQTAERSPATSGILKIENVAVKILNCHSIEATTVKVGSSYTSRLSHDEGFTIRVYSTR